MKSKATILVLALIIALAGCTSQPAPTPTPTPTPTTTPAVTPTTTPAATPTPTPDATTTASIVNTEAAFEKAIGKNGTWIIATLKDLTFTNDLVLEGDFHDKNDPAKPLKRKIALYAQDADKNVTARYTLTAPKLTIKSPMASLQHGTFKGDLYVTTNDFQLVDNTVDGNIYFSTDAAKSGFKMDDKSKVTGKQEVKK